MMSDLGETSDLLKWNDALSGTSILSADSIDTLHKRHVTTTQSSRFYGYGWITRDTPVGKLHWHNGSNGHHYATMQRFTDQDLLIIILANELNDTSACLATYLARATTSELANWTGP